ncbi:MAG: ATP-binding protein, partial [Syntrophomonadaceae bacterium]|nr:ATP-binding protein [Syntrophomonadaceae bacterium]
SRGGGIVDIISLALRIALLETSRPALDGPLILDEPAKHVSQDYSHNVAEFLKLVVNTFERQVIMVTHNSYLADSGDKAFEVKIESGVTQVIPR